MAFDDLTAEDLAAASRRIAADTLHSARLVAAEYLVAGPGASAGDAATAVDVLLARDPADSRFELLQAFEKPWAALTIRILAPVADPTSAMQDARDRGVTAAAIAKALGVTQQALYQNPRYADIVRKPR
ncbi:hypothetical protein [Mycolicibacterium frederiksbergense]|uniref:Uncharacterized protein n=1 Tax=Mycolicibacterium frederiksbergense TaxID=117567 RepID=A0A6H0RWN4_9MYCO|nr:hypothetical protein [Mycolicibacterium frederiksbergense]QIV79623.1 hypothetical protein EXE63_00845 [Mycolicibacterium frederiksbergense]